MHIYIGWEYLQVCDSVKPSGSTRKPPVYGGFPSSLDYEFKAMNLENGEVLVLEIPVRGRLLVKQRERGLKL